MYLLVSWSLFFDRMLHYEMAELPTQTYFIYRYLFIEDTCWQTVPIWHAKGEHF